MKYKNINSSSTANISVFLSIILLLIISLFLITLEGARVSVVKSFTTRSFVQALDSVFAQYHAPLLDDYHIFALEASYGTGQVKEENIIDNFEKYFLYSLVNEASNISNSATDFLGVSLDETSIINLSNMLDYDGGLFEYQVIEHMKSSLIGDVIDNLSASKEEIEKSETISKISKSKENVENELVEIDKNILKLMTLLDGVKTKKTGIKLSKKNKLSIENDFIKNICTDTINQSNVAINNTVVFNAVKDKYLNPILISQDIKKRIDVYKEYEDKINSIREEIDKDDEANNETLIKTLDFLTDSLEKNKDLFNKDKKKLKNLIKTKSALIDKALQVIELIEEKSEGSKPLIEVFEAQLLSEKEKIEDDIYNEFDLDLQEMKTYIDNKQGVDLKKIKEVLKNDKNVIEEVMVYVNTIVNEKSYEEVNQNISLFDNKILEYNIKDLKLDYSSLYISNKKEENLIDKIKSSIDNGILGLIVDINKISDKEIKVGGLPSAYLLAEKGKGDESKFSIENIFSSFSNLNLVSSIDSGINKGLVVAYINDNFSNYIKSQSSDFISDNYALSYEEEYIINKNNNDKDNLSATINKILLIRTMMNFISILSNKSLLKDAELISTSLIGFTGMPMLIKAIKVLLLITLSFVESLVDIAAMLKNKYVMIIKAGSDIVCDFKDILLLSNKHISSLSDKIEGSKGFAKMSYENYINMFLYITDQKKINYKSMDLIQKNINLRYDDNFLMKNCIFDIRMKVNGGIRNKFCNFYNFDGFNNDQYYKFTNEGVYSY